MLAIVDPGDIPDGWASIIVAAITVFGGGLIVQIVGLVNSRRNRSAIETVNSKVDAIRDHTVNSHTDRNMREEMDDRHAETMHALAALKEESRATRADLGGIRSEIRQERQERHALAERVTSLEK